MKPGKGKGGGNSEGERDGEGDIPEQIDGDAGIIGWPTYESDTIGGCIPNRAINYIRAQTL